MDLHSGKKLIEQKVEDFAKNRAIYTSKKFDETETRTHFINPLFAALGWQFGQTGIPYHLWDVHQEFAQKDKKRRTKKPDYAFRLNGKVKFFAEAKAPSVDLTDKDPIFQAKSYAFSTNGRAPIVVLTDFEEFRVFNALQKPVYDNPNLGLFKDLDFKYTDYIDHWDKIYATFSKEAVSAGSLDRLRGKINKNTKTLDREFLEQLVEWRETLALRLGKDNPQLTAAQLNEAVQRILDRLIFIRNLEDRQIETDIDLLALLDSKDEVYSRLLPIFKRLDADYNGLLYHPHFSEKLQVDDKTLRHIIKHLYPNLSPFQFDAIEPEILGRIYENFLGSKIYINEKTGKPKVEEKPEVRHAKGVYYTPEWVVEVIVKKTVAPLIEGKSPEDIKKIKILDPACGSGSFLLGAYAYLIDYHRAYYAAHPNEKKYKGDYFIDEHKELFLTIEKQTEILRNNIFGVDLDREATEVAIMSLYIKAFEGVKGQGHMFKREKLLPDMTENIRVGNSLLSRDDLLKHNMFGDADIAAFDWHDEKLGFGKIFKDNGGFDAIIGNPPYIRIQEMQKWAPKEVELYKKLYHAGRQGNFDIYVLFIERAMQLLNARGRFGMILPNKFFTAEYGEGIRSLIHKNVHEIIDFGDQQVFANATTYTNILVLGKTIQNTFAHYSVRSLNEETIPKIVDYVTKSKAKDQGFIKVETLKSESLNVGAWYFESKASHELFVKLKSDKQTLGDYCAKVLVGIQTSADPVFILLSNENKKLFSKSLNKPVSVEPGILRPLLKGKEIRRYTTPKVQNYIILPYSIEGGEVTVLDASKLQNDYPNTWEYFRENKKKLSERDISGDPKIWWQFGRNQNIAEMANKKIITQVLASRASFTYDPEGKYYFVGGGNAGGYGIKLKPEYEHLYYYVLGCLNSALLDKYLQSISTRFRGGFYSYAKRFIEKLPIYIPTEKEPAKFEKCRRIAEYAQQIMQLYAQGKDADAQFLEKKIDELVEEVYLG